jgi:hypothetical protein
MFPFQGSSSLSMWIITPTISSKETLVFNIYGFIIDLLIFKAFDSIFVVIDWLTNMAHFIPCNKTVTNEEIARLFMDNIYKYHGLPNDIISNRGSQFHSKFWQSLFKILKVKIQLYFAYDPQIDGQTERINQVLEQYLHCTINYHKDKVVITCQICVQQYHPKIYSLDPILCQLWVPSKVWSIRLQQCEKSNSRKPCYSIVWNIYKDEG